MEIKKYGCLWWILMILFSYMILSGGMRFFKCLFELIKLLGL